MDVLAATWSRRNVSTLRSLELQTMRQGSATQPLELQTMRQGSATQPLELQTMRQGSATHPVWSMYRESLREVLLNRPGECTANVLRKFPLTNLENVQRMCKGSSP
jgi:hypothetical protein